ncbi:MAG: cytochrome c nitrite reductase small subunit [Planctomycetota bacterium]
MKACLQMLFTLGFLPTTWRMPCWIAFGCFVGLGAATVHISRAPSYLGNSPETCINCHVMNNAYLTWNHSSHREVATCNDCHVPHDNFIHTYSFKARDGMRHATIFTMRAEPQVIELSTAAIPVVQSNCVRCHGGLVGEVHRNAWQPGDQRCWDCHREVPHGRVNSLSTSLDVMRPRLPSVGSDPHQMNTGGRPVRPAKDTTHE